MCQFRSCGIAINSKGTSTVSTLYSELELKCFIISVLFLKSQHRMYLAFHKDSQTPSRFLAMLANPVSIDGGSTEQPFKILLVCT